MFFNLIVQVHNVKDVHKLAFVLMKSLNLYVKDGVRIYFDSVVLQNVLSKTYFVTVFDVHEFLLCLLVICINFQFCKFWKVGNPAITNMLCNPVCQKWVSVKQETSLGNTVGLIVEFFRIHFIEIF